MLIAANIAGLSWKESEKFRKAVSKQKHDIMASMKDCFISGCISNSNFSEDTANALWDQIQFFGGYGFNKAHAVGYAMLTYLTAYLKAHYPLEYYTALLSFKGEDEDERRKYIYEAKKGNINILNPDINLSTNECRIVNEGIYLPLTFVKGIGPAAFETIAQERSKGEFQSYSDFCNRMTKSKVNKRLRERLVSAGAFDSLEDRAGIICEDQEISDIEMAIKEYDSLGFYISGILSSWYESGTFYINELADLALGEKFTAMGIVEVVREHIDRNGDLMAFVTLTDSTGQLEVILFAGVYEYSLTKGDFISVEAKMDGYEPLKAIAASFSVLSAAVEA